MDILNYQNADMKNLFLCIVCLVFIKKTNGQQWADSVSVKMTNYAVIKKSDLLFVHTDKHIYTNNEFIWFSAYLLHEGQDSFPRHRFLSLMLVQADIRAAVIQQKFTIVKGWGYGSLQLPDSIAPGEYKLVAYTNVIGKDSLPAAVYTQDLSVRSLQQPDFIADMNIVENSTGRKDVIVTVRDKNTQTPVRDC